MIVSAERDSVIILACHAFIGPFEDLNALSVFALAYREVMRGCFIPYTLYFVH